MTTQRRTWTRWSFNKLARVEYLIEKGLDSAAPPVPNVSACVWGEGDTSSAAPLPAALLPVHESSCSQPHASAHKHAQVLMMRVFDFERLHPDYPAWFKAWEGKHDEMKE